MKAVIVACLFFLSACATCPECPPCPPEKAFYPIGTPYGIIFGQMAPGYYDDKDNWLTEEEYKEYMEDDDLKI